MLHGVPLINYRKNYTGKEVREFLAIYRNKYYEAMRRGNKIRKRLNKFKIKKKEILKNYDKRYKITYLRLHGEKARYKKMKQKYVALLKEEKQKTKKFILEKIKEVRKSERNRIKNYYYNPNIKSNPGNYEIITWARILIKLTNVSLKTKLKPKEIVAILWIASHEEGEATGSMWSKQMGIKSEALVRFCNRLVHFNLVRSEKVKNKNVFYLTERGKNFLKPIVEYVKKEHANAKRVKRKIIRNRVSNAKTTSGLQDGGDAIHQEGTVL